MSLEINEALEGQIGSLKPGVTVSQAANVLERDYAHCGVTITTHLGLTGIDRVIRIDSHYHTNTGLPVYLVVQLGKNPLLSQVMAVVYAGVGTSSTLTMPDSQPVNWIEVRRSRGKLWRYLMNLQPHVSFGLSA